MQPPPSSRWPWRRLLLLSATVGVALAAWGIARRYSLW
jgi:hypothetical protein